MYKIATCDTIQCNAGAISAQKSYHLVKTSKFTVDDEVLPFKRTRKLLTKGGNQSFGKIQIKIPSMLQQQR